MGSRLNRQGPGGLHGLQAGEEVRTFFFALEAGTRVGRPGVRVGQFFRSGELLGAQENGRTVISGQPRWGRDLPY